MYTNLNRFVFNFWIPQVEKIFPAGCGSRRCLESTECAKMLPHINKDREVLRSWYSNLAFAIKYPPDGCDGETNEISLSCYSKHDILCAAQDIFSHEYKLPAICYEIFPPDWHPIMYIQSGSNKISSDQYTICAESLLAALAINCAAKQKWRNI